MNCEICGRELSFAEDQAAGMHGDCFAGRELDRLTESVSVRVDDFPPVNNHCVACGASLVSVGGNAPSDTRCFNCDKDKRIAELEAQNKRLQTWWAEKFRAVRAAAGLDETAEIPEMIAIKMRELKQRAEMAENQNEEDQHVLKGLFDQIYSKLGHLCPTAHSPAELIDIAGTELKIGNPLEQPLPDVPMDRQIVLLNREVVKLAHHLRTILAVAHRDGGHHAEQHGLEKSTEEAVKKWYELRKRMDEAKNVIEELFDALTEFGAVSDNTRTGRALTRTDAFLAQQKGKQ